MVQSRSHRILPNISIDGMEWADGEGRCVGIKIAGLEVWSMYFPSGTSGAERQTLKMTS